LERGRCKTPLHLKGNIKTPPLQMERGDVKHHFILREIKNSPSPNVEGRCKTSLYFERDKKLPLSIWRGGWGVR
jgi:hypothetical protein